MRSLDSSAAFHNLVDVDVTMVIDPYLYPDSDVLQNLLGIRQKDRLKALIDSAADQALQNAVSLPLTPSADGLALLHKALFGSIFAWAGECRSTTLAYDGNHFARVDLIGASLDARYDAFARSGDASGNDTARFYDTLAHHISEIYAISPFRAGNEGLLKVHAAQLANAAGQQIDWTRLTPDMWGDLLVQSFISLDHQPIASALQGLLNSSIGPEFARTGIAGLAIPPMRDPPTGKHYLTPIRKIGALLDESFGLAKREAFDNIARLERETDNEAALSFARHELGFVTHTKGPMFQLEILRDIGIPRIRVLINPAHSALETVRELSAAIVIALHSQPQPLIEQLVLSHSAPPCPVGVSPHNERMARTFLHNSASANRADPRFAGLQHGLDNLGLSESVVGGFNAKQLGERTSQARLDAASHIRAGDISLAQPPSAFNAVTGSKRLGADLRASA